MILNIDSYMPFKFLNKREAHYAKIPGFQKKSSASLPKTLNVSQ